MDWIGLVLAAGEGIEWWREPLFVGIASGVSGVFVTWLLLHKPKPFKRVDIYPRGPYELVNINERVKDRLKVEFDGEPVDSVSSFHVRLRCTGSEPICNQPLTIILGDDCQIVDYECTTDPDTEFGEIEEVVCKRNMLKLKIALLNPSDSVKVRIIAIGKFDKKIDIYVKNEGVKERHFNFDYTIRDLFDDLAPLTAKGSVSSMFQTQKVLWKIALKTFKARKASAAAIKPPTSPPASEI